MNAKQDLRPEKEIAMNWDLLEDKLTALGESEMQMFRFLLDRPAGVILTAR